jgi:sugar phosphate isomerase/epimerase
VPPLFVSTACLPGCEELSLRLQKLASVGIRNIELGGGVRLDKPFSKNLIPANIKILLHNYFPPPAIPFVLNLASRSLQIREASVALVRNAIRLSAELGAGFFSVHGGFITDAVSFGTHSFAFPMPAHETEAADAMKRFVEVLAALGKEAQRAGISLLIENNVCSVENKGKLLFQCAEEFEDFFEQCDLPNVGILLDTGHLNVSSRTYGFEPHEFVDRLERRIQAFHVHGNDGIEDRHQEVRKNDWIIPVLTRARFAQAPIIMETKFKDLDSLRRGYSQLCGELSSGGPMDESKNR